MIADTERELLGAALDDPRITASIKLTECEFHQPAHGAIWEAIRKLHSEGTHPTPSLILAASTVKIDPAILPELVGAGMVINADRYAEEIADDHRRRSIGDALFAAKRALDAGTETDRVVSDLSSGLGVATQIEQDAEDLVTIGEFIDQELPPEEWIIPGLFAVGERAIVTGDEGLGKSMLMRQMALCTAAGLHPFTFTRFKPARVLIIDAENPKRIMINKFRGIHQELVRRQLDPDQRCWVKRYPQGMDLAQSRDRLALHNLCTLTRPDLLVIGPAYKLYVGGSNSREEDLARQVTSTLDGLREEFGFALLLEHHSPHESQNTGKRFPRPIGSSLWRRWPEYGLGIVRAERTGHPRQRVVEVKHWRGGREDRPWPTELESGGRLPWVASDPSELEGAA